MRVTFGKLSKNIKIKMRLTILVLVIIVPLVSLYVTELNDNYNDGIHKRTENTENAVSLVGSFFNNIFNNIWYLQETSAEQIKNSIDENGNYTRLEYTKEAIRNLIEPLEYVDSVSVFNELGEYKFGVNKNIRIEEEIEIYNDRFAETEVYKKILDGEDRVLSNETTETKNGDMYITSSTDGNNKENEIIIVFRIDLNEFKDETFKGYHIDYGTFGIINDKGEIVYDQSLKLDTIELEALDYYSYYEDSVSLTVDIPNTGWKVYAEGFIEKYKEELEAEITDSIALFAIVTLLIALICVELSKYIVGGTKKLKNVVDEVSNSNKRIRTNMKAYDEIGEVGKAIDLMLDQLEEVDKERNGFSIMMAHEVRTPLNVVFSAVQCLEELNKDKCKNKDSLKKYCNIIKENCYRLSKLVNNIFMATQISSNELILEKKNVDIVACIEDYIYIVSKNIKAKNINIIFDTEYEKIIVECDYKRINNIMLNILSNSIKFSENNSTIFIEVKDKKDYIEILIKDEGKGISDEAIDRVFNSYESGEDILNRRAEGMGLGLYIAKGIVKSHNGTIEIDSKEGRGTAVSIKLPKVINEDEEPLYIEYDEHEVEEKVRVEFSDIY